MLIGTGLVASGGVDAARAALAVFVALALAETVLPLRRGLAEIGRIRDAAGRVLAEPGRAPPPTAPHAGTTPASAAPDAQAVRVAGLACGRPGARAAIVSGLSFDVAPGEALALTGPSGAGKSSVLHALAGLEPPLAGTVRLGDRCLADLAEAELRAAVCLVPQRAALLGGTIRENLALARDGAEEAEMQAALSACHLADRIAAMGGLDARLAEGGAGLSGGEARRLVLARALLRRPAVLLLDEPTEGLDAATARAVLDGLRAALPSAVIVTASHRAVERDWADQTLPVRPRAEVAPRDMQTFA
jgi:ATP-binding cassette subfamily C protein CydC